MSKRSQFASQQIIPIGFRFLKLPVTWRIVGSDELEQFWAEKLKARAVKRGKPLSKKKIGVLLKNTLNPKGPVLFGEYQTKVSLETPYAIKELNGWHCRDQFFELRENQLDELAGFLNEVGAWPSSGEPNPNIPGLALRYPAIVQPEDVWTFRADLRDALQNQKRFKEAIASKTPAKPMTWLGLYSAHRANIFQFSFEMSDESSDAVAGLVTLTNARHMLFATALSDVARHVRFKKCSGKGCLQLFPAGSKHGRRFHSKECGHLALVRRRRMEIARMKASGKSS